MQPRRRWRSWSAASKRQRGFGAVRDALTNVLVRVLSKRDDWARWVSDVVAIEVL